MAISRRTVETRATQSGSMFGSGSGFGQFWLASLPRSQRGIHQQVPEDIVQIRATSQVPCFGPQDRLKQEESPMSYSPLCEFVPCFGRQDETVKLSFPLRTPWLNLPRGEKVMLGCGVWGGANLLLVERSKSGFAFCWGGWGGGGQPSFG